MDGLQPSRESTHNQEENTVKRYLFLVPGLMCLTLIACGHTVHLDKLSSEMSLAQLQRSLTDDTDIDLGRWRVTRIYATLLHKSMAAYRSDLPPEGLGIDFYIKGFESNFVVENMAFTVEDGRGKKATITGLGTDHAMLSGNLAEGRTAIGFVVLGKINTRNGEYVNRFRIILPIELEKGLVYLKIAGQDMGNSRIRFRLKWNLS